MIWKTLIVVLSAAFIMGCEKDSPMQPEKMPTDPDKAAKASVDRFSMQAGNLFVRDGSNGLPGANAAINFDQGPFITQGLGPDGQVVKYYNFDVQPTTPAPIFALFRSGEDTPVENQLNIIDVIPGDTGYNDFWHVHKVTVPQNYVANTITSAQQIMDGNYAVEETDMLVNCPVVPQGSTAQLRLIDEDNGLIRGWYKNQVVFYFTFGEKALKITADKMVPVSPIYVTFNINPDQIGGGPTSGFVTENMSVQTHNVVETLPANAAYSPLWSVNVYDNSDFNSVSNLSTARTAQILAEAVATPNCPIVEIQ